MGVSPHISECARSSTSLSFVAHLPDILVPISKAQQEVRQDMHHIGLKQLAQHVAQHLKCKQGTLERDKLIKKQDCKMCNGSLQWVHFQ